MGHAGWAPAVWLKLRVDPLGPLGAGKPSPEPRTDPEAGGAGRLVQPRCVQWIIGAGGGGASEEQQQGPRLETLRLMLPPAYSPAQSPSDSAFPPSAHFKSAITLALESFQPHISEP